MHVCVGVVCFLNSMRQKLVKCTIVYTLKTQSLQHAVSRTQTASDTFVLYTHYTDMSAYCWSHLIVWSQLNMNVSYSILAYVANKKRLLLQKQTARKLFPSKRNAVSFSSMFFYNAKTSSVTAW